MKTTTRALAGLICGALIWAIQFAAADQVTLQNGDTYRGKVVSMNSNSVVFQSEMLGQLTFGRAKVHSIVLGTTPPTTTATNLQPRTTSVTQSNLNSDLTAAFRNLGSQTNLIQQVQAQFLATAGPEANAKFNQMMADLMNGKMNLTDLRSQAKTAADQLRSYKKELGSDAGGGELDSYLAILDSFVAEVAAEPSTTTTTNTAKPARK